MRQELLEPVETLKGVGEARAKLLEKIGVRTLFDLITYFPRDYEDRTHMKQIVDTVLDEVVCVEAMVAAPVEVRRIRKGLSLAKTRVVDETGGMALTFFNQDFVKDQLTVGQTYVFYGKIEGNFTKREMNTPVFEPVTGTSKTRRLVPVYPLTAGLRAHQIAGYVQAALARCRESLSDPIPDHVREAEHLAFVEFAYDNIHRPEDRESLEIAKRRLIFEELYLLSLGLLLIKSRRADLVGVAFPPAPLEPFIDALPFMLTGAQHRAIADATHDMQKETPMNRLVQGDVGSGKTVVAAACAYFAQRNGFQTAIMAPTEILAEQHFAALAPLFARLGIRVTLLTGSLSVAEKRKRKAALLSGEADLVIGTHALLTEDVAFARLGLVVTDEQHRFGVRQRAALAAKGENPHLLVMSATPIPRTLALILYGDLEISVIDELPPGRQPIQTYAVDDAKRARAYGFVRKHLDMGRQAYVVCPLVEENDALALKAAESFAAHLTESEFAGYRVAVLHGRMKPKEKDRVMRAFSAGEIQVLVATTVIEVGVNVPNATVMVVENAERFGLAQLHQLRGRVGRGSEQSYCILFSQARHGITWERLQALCKSNDGFFLSEEDLRLRGPGDFFGTRQHGVPDLKLADLARDLLVLRRAQDVAKALLRDDPALTKPEHREIRERIQLLFDEEIFN